MNFGIRELIFLVVLLAMPMSSYWFVFKPQNEEIAQAKKEIEQKELMLEKLEAATSQAVELAARIGEIQSGITTVEARLPNDKEVDRVLQQVSDLAKEHRLKVPRFKPMKTVNSGRYKEKPIEVQAEGYFDDFYEFLLAIEKMERIMRLPDLTLERNDDDDGSMSAEFTLTVYFEDAASEEGA
jgi:Tfp pilus assembly protein PilO